MVEATSVVLIGFHGTNAANVDSILASGFRPSNAEGLWYGPGVYFFGEGISRDPAKDAENWLREHSFDKGRQSFKFESFAIIKAEIKPRKLLDLTTDEGKLMFNHARDELISRGIKPPKGDYVDADVIGFLIKIIHFDVFITDVFVRASQEKGNKLRARTPNVRFICVNDESAIDPSSLVVVNVQPFEFP